MIETAGFILGILGVVFAFEAPRKTFVKLFRPNTESKKMHEQEITNHVESIKNELNRSDSLDLTPQDIADKKVHLSEIEFDDYFKSFIGHIITWEGIIGTVTTKKSGSQTVTIQMKFYNNRLRGFFDINLKDYPNVKLFKSGDIAIVTGEIQSPNWPTFDLVDATILKWARKAI